MRKLLVLLVVVVALLGAMAAAALADGYQNSTPTSCYRTGGPAQGHTPGWKYCPGQMVN